MEIDTLIKLIQKSNKTNLVIKLKRLLKKIKQLEDAEMLFNALFYDETEFDIYTAKIISVHVIYMRYFLDEEMYEELEILRQLFEENMKNIINIYKDNANIEEKKIYIKFAINYNQTSNNLPFNLNTNIQNLY